MLLDRDHGTFSSFDFGLDRRLMKAVARLGFVYPTLVQSRSIPLALEGKDMLVRARTGSGKTAAFALPTLHKILLYKSQDRNAKPGVLAVILVPTKELCDQTYRTFWDLTYYCRDTVTIQALVGDNMSAQQALLRDLPDVLISTPSRLLSHVKAGNVKLKDTVQSLVMDEADLILSFGYDDDVKAVVSSLPRIYQGMLMSATLSPELDDLKRVVLHNPAILKLEEGRTDGELLQFYVTLSEEDKLLLIFVFLKLGVLEGKGLFFVNSLDACYGLKLFLEQFSIRSAVLNAELPLNSRLHTLQEFNRGIFDYLIATDESMDACGEGGEEEQEEEEEEEEEEGDEEEEEEDEDDEEEEEAAKPSKAKGKAGKKKATVADKKEEEEARRSKDKATKKKEKRQQRKNKKDLNAVVEDAEYGVHRGIDFQAVQFVVNVDFPRFPRSYTHRIGRTARGGANGTALSLINKDSKAQLAVLAEVQANQPALPPLEGDTNLENLGAPGDTGNASTSLLRSQPAPLAFDLKELEGFRYRVEDVKRAVTKMAVKEARLAEIKQELLNSEALKSHFQENPHEFQILRHDKGILPSNKIQDHLKHVPDYLLPKGMRVGQDPSAKKRKRRRGGRKRAQGQGTDRQRRKDNDPLQSFDEPGGDLDGGEDLYEDDDDGEGEEDPFDGGGLPVEDRIYQEGEELGKSTAGRVEWQQRHKKGKFAKVPRLSQKQRKISRKG